MDAYASDFPPHQPLPFAHGSPSFPQPMSGNPNQSYSPNLPPSASMMHPAQQQMHYLQQRGPIQNQTFAPQQQQQPPFSSPHQPLSTQTFLPSSSQPSPYPPTTQPQFQQFAQPAPPQFTPYTQAPPQSPAHIHQQPPRLQQPSPQAVPRPSQPPPNAQAPRKSTPITTTAAQSGSMAAPADGSKMQQTPTQTSTTQQHTPTGQKPGGSTPQSPSGSLPVDPKVMEQRIDALLEINSELLREMIELQSKGRGGVMPTPPQPGAPQDAEKKEAPSPEFIELMKRFQANLAFVIFWHERATNKGKPGQPTPRGPAIMTPPHGYDKIAELYAKMVPLFNGWKGPAPKPVQQPPQPPHGTSSPGSGLSAQQIQAQRARMAAQMQAQQQAQHAVQQQQQHQAQQQAQLHAMQQKQMLMMQQQQQQQQPPK